MLVTNLILDYNISTLRPVFERRKYHMDNVLANVYRDRFIGFKFNGYTVIDMIDFGKSAVVFEGIASSGKKLAIKIFDIELVARFGEDTQKQRIFRENSLRNHGIKGLVDIVDGGTFMKDNKEYHYIVMPFLHGCNLKKHIAQNGAWNEESAKNIFSCLNEITNHLLTIKNIAHRDIKPENIMVMDDGEIVLMDLGVLKPIGESDLTDVGDVKPFIGTLRYAPSEYLLRTESNTPDGWRSVNLYQIGAVLHDVILGVELFKQYSEPFANLVTAVIERSPQIDRADYNQEFVQLVRNMLAKDWKTRLQRASDNEIRRVMDAPLGNKKDDILSGILQKQVKFKVLEDEIQQIEKNKADAKNKLIKMQQNISQIIESCLTEVQNSKAIKSWRHNFNGRPLHINHYVKSYILSGDYSQGFLGEVEIFFSIPMDLNACRVGIIAEIRHSISNITNQNSSTFRGNNQTLNTIPSNCFISIFNGVFNEDYVKSKIMDAILKIIRAALKIMEPWVEAEYESKKSGQRIRMISMHSNKIIDTTNVRLYEWGD